MLFNTNKSWKENAEDILTDEHCSNPVGYQGGIGLILTSYHTCVNHPNTLPVGHVIV